MKTNQPELLMPAGDFEKMKYAFAFGADAVYAGYPQFSLRARENGFTEQNLHEGVQYARERGKKFYLTVNIVAHNRKLRPFQKKLDDLLSTKPDAFIMADPGMIEMVKERDPNAVIHLSVQANAMNWATVKFWHKLGVSRIILSRELSIDEIKEIKDHVPEMELEAFVHGAICIAHSGRCLMSNFFSYRDANDGCCNNACRWEYNVYERKDTPENNPATGQYIPLKGDFYLEELNRPGQFMRIDEDEHGTYLMNAKDLMAIEYLKEMRDAGIDSFKAEGRTKSIYYLSMATRAYRRAIDDLMENKPFNPQHVVDLQKIHHRGYTPGFLINRADHTIQRYEQGITDMYTQEFGAVVLKQEANRILVTPRNKVCVGDHAEIITPNKSFTLTIESMIRADNGESVPSIHGGTNWQVWIPFSEDLEGQPALLSRIVPNPNIEDPVRKIESTEPQQKYAV